MRAGPAAAIAVLGVGVLATVAVPVDWWRPAIICPVLLPVAALAVWLARGVPSHPFARVPVWTAVSSVAVAVGFGLWAGLTRGEHLIIRRDAGSYALFAHWLATRHYLPVDADLAAFGGPSALHVDGFSLASPAFFQVLTGSGGPGPGGATGAQVVPQFLLGAPALYSLGWWSGGWTGLFVVPAVVGALAVLACAGLTTRLVGPAWAPVAAAGLAITQPVLHAARSTLSEPATLLLMLAAAAVAVDAVQTVDASSDPRRVRRLAVLAGSLLGLAGLVRVDVLREVAIAVPVCAVLALRRHRAALPLACSALITAGLTMIPAWVLSRPYLDLVGASLRPLTAGTIGLALISGLVLVLAHRHLVRQPVGPRPLDRLVDRLVPVLAGAAVVAVGLGLASRPLWSTVRQRVDDTAVPLIASLQKQQGLPIDGARTYAEQSVTWLLWYVGPSPRWWPWSWPPSWRPTPPDGGSLVVPVGRRPGCCHSPWRSARSARSTGRGSPPTTHGPTGAGAGRPAGDCDRFASCGGLGGPLVTPGLGPVG
jgi:hypothetical protein